jgi:hypothetical protein
MPFLLFVGALVAAFMLVMWARRVGGDAKPSIDRVLAAHGAARCMEASRVIQGLTQRADQRALTEVWEAIELPLLKALPDCPPDYKVQLINVLDAASKAATNRELAKRIMTLRNSLIA